MPDGQPSQDAPPVLAELINRHGVTMGNRIADFAQEIGDQMDGTIRAAYAHGIAEGMEVAAQAAETYAVATQIHNVAVAEMFHQLRDQLRMAALSVEMPT